MILLYLDLKQEALPHEILNSDKVDKKIRIPMVKNNRSLNLSNSVGIVAIRSMAPIKF